jgi:hypothetical protein
MIRTLPDHAEALRILARMRTRPPRRPPPPAARALIPALRSLDKKFGHGADALKSRWREIVGEACARRTEPVRLSTSRTGAGASLEIRVDGPAATIIQHQAADILARVNLFLGAGTVERLRIVQGPLRRPLPAGKAPERPRSRAPLDAAAERDLADGLAKLPEGPLKAALTRLGREVMRGPRA